MKRNSFLVMAALFLLMLCLPVSAKAATYKWVSTGNGNMRCYQDGKLVKSKWVGDKHLNSKGYMDRNKWVSKKVNGVKTSVFVRDDGKWVKNFKSGWQKIKKKYYYYRSNGEMVKSSWLKVSGYMYYVNSKGYRITGLQKFTDGYRYFASDGKMQTGWQLISGNRYYFRVNSGLALTDSIFKFNSGRSYCFGKQGKMQTGWIKKNKKYYYFDPYMLTGWQTIGGSRYYLNTATGERATGVYGVSGKLYYFDPDSGKMQTSTSLGTTTISYDGRKYKIDKNGECILMPGTDAPSADMLFFLTFESGSEAYNQTGGDYGSACGAYQFDYRYSLLDFVQYAYLQNAKLCAEFKPYMSYTSGANLKSNNKLYKAWHTIYKRNPALFAELQDKFAKKTYYDPVEANLRRSGVNLATRSDVVKGAVYSYSIQHGQQSAVNAVLACRIKSSTTDKQFLKKLYNYRIKQFPAYTTRYTAEKNLALKRL